MFSFGGSLGGGAGIDIIYFVQIVLFQVFVIMKERGFRVVRFFINLEKLEIQNFM